jgi:hypothetical protein
MATEVIYHPMRHGQVHVCLAFFEEVIVRPCIICLIFFVFADIDIYMLLYAGI